MRRWLPRDRGRIALIAFAGLRPAVEYGTAVTGISDAELRRVQSALLAVVPPAAAGASLAAKKALAGDPAWRCRIAAPMSAISFANFKLHHPRSVL